MNQHIRRQEDRAEQKLRNIGFVLVEDTGRRHTGAGDRVMYHPDTGLKLTIDHKSTRGKEGIRVERKWLEKIKQEAAPGSLPAITFSFLNCQRVYMIIDISDLEGVMY